MFADHATMTAPAAPLFEARGYPVFQNRMYDSAAAARDCPKGDIRLAPDGQSGIIVNATFDPSSVVYDAAYQNEQGNSAAFAAHLGTVARLVLDTMGRGPLIEVGCGKATFLDLLRARGADITGFDPTYEGDDPTIRRHYFEPGLGLQATGLILRHVLEHVPGPVTFLRNLAHANGGRGLIYIEVPCLDWIAENRAWFDLFYEHCNYFRLSDFHRIFARVVHAGRAFGGQYLTVVADLSEIRADPLPAAAPFRLPQPFAPQFGAARPDDVIWGAGSKGVIYALLRQRAGAPVGALVDINPAKQGRFVPASGIQVLDPATALRNAGPDARIIVMNPNYLDEVQAMTGRHCILAEDA